MRCYVSRRDAYSRCVPEGHVGRENGGKRKNRAKSPAVFVLLTNVLIASVTCRTASWECSKMGRSPGNNGRVLCRTISESAICCRMHPSKKRLLHFPGISFRRFYSDADVVFVPISLLATQRDGNARKNGC